MRRLDEMQASTCGRRGAGRGSSAPMQAWVVIGLGGLSLAAATGCTITSGVRGVVVARGDCGAGPGAPLPAAEVHLECPGEPPRTVQTDASGRFFLELKGEYLWEGDIASDCVVRVHKVGYRDQLATVGDVCARGKREKNWCSGASVYAELAPLTSAPPPGPPRDEVAPTVAPAGGAP